MRNWSLNAVRAAALLNAPQPATPAPVLSLTSPAQPDHTPLVEVAAFRDFTEALIATHQVRPESAGFIAGEVLERLTFDAADAPSEDVNTLVDKLKVAFPFSFVPARIEPDPIPVPADPRETAWPVTYAAAQAAKATPAATDDANPWAPGSISLTRQVWLEARDPDRAAKLKAMAER